MKMKISGLMIVVLAFFLNAFGESLELRFVIHPRLDPVQVATDSMQTPAENDSIRVVRIYGGKICKGKVSSKVVLETLQRVHPDCAMPTDYFFDSAAGTPRIIASNIKPPDSLAFVKPWHIVAVDSLRVGIFSLYTPDYGVKRDLGKGIRFDYDVRQAARKVITELENRCDVLILLTDIPKYAAEGLALELKDRIDWIVSTDYQSTQDTSWGSTRWRSIKNGYTGVLRLDANRNPHWSEVKRP